MQLPHRDRLLLPLIWFCTVTWLSTKGGISLPGFNLIGTDKLAHAAAYALLTWLILIAYGRANRELIVGAVAFSFTYGAFMEWVQYTFFPNRFFELDDMVANGVGAVIGAFVFWYFKK